MRQPSDPPPPIDRYVRLAGTRNLRDVGGYRAGTGRRTRWRTLLRSDSLSELPPASQAAILDLGVRQVIDLRHRDEVDSWPSVFVRSPAVRYMNVSMVDEPPRPSLGIRGIYRMMLNERGHQIARVAAALAEADGLPAIVGCAAGVDRTGVTVAVILRAAGVEPEDIAADYALSAASFRDDGAESGLNDFRRGPIAIDSDPDTMIATLRHLQRRYSGAESYLISHGLTTADVERLAALLTEPSA
jgi:protein-tyrosine phosphatase